MTVLLDEQSNQDVAQNVKEYSRIIYGKKAEEVLNDKKIEDEKPIAKTKEVVQRTHKAEQLIS